MGFSIGAASLLLIGLHTFHRDLELPRYGRVGAHLMLLGLIATQAVHAGVFPGLSAEQVGYALLLLLQSLGFHWLFLGMLRPESTRLRWHEWLIALALVPLIVVLPFGYAVALVMSYGGGVALHLGSLVRRLGDQRKFFVLELRVLAAFAAMAAIVALIAFWAAFNGYPAIWVPVYCVMITAGFALVWYLLLAIPDLSVKTRAAVVASYASSTLSKVDREQAKARVTQLFEQERVFEDDALSLSKLSDLLKLSSHQASELINSEFGIGFSQLLRQYRVEAAKRMLLAETQASVLSVGLSVGFSSQSNFYVAFKALTGMNPGEYRRLQR